MHMPFSKRLSSQLVLAGLGLALTACNTTIGNQLAVQNTSPTATGPTAEIAFQADRSAILAMAGDYKVKFDFKETVSFQGGYELKKPYITGGHEMVRVIADTGTFISLQHILIAGDGKDTPYFPIKHWRQDWQYQPTHLLEYAGANVWNRRALKPIEYTGNWSQAVYQVDDAPRYASVAKWEHVNGTSAWTSPASLRPLPRRDAIKRDDYHAISAINRHALTPNGWVHEQDNSKLILDGDEPRILAREIGINSYMHTDTFETEVGSKYWENTKDFWKEIRAEWAKLSSENPRFGLTILGEADALYMPMLGIAAEVDEGKTSTATAVHDAKETLWSFVNTQPRTVQERLVSHIVPSTE